MKVLQNLYVCYNKIADFTIRLCAYSELDASILAKEYRIDSALDSKFEIKELENIDNTHFDWDYVIF